MAFKPRNIQRVPLSDEARAAFGGASAPAWCLELLRDASLRPIASPNQQPKASGEDSFIAETLATDATIRAWQSFYKQLPPSASADGRSPGNSAGELLSLLALGRGINGHIDTAHGGAIAAIFDEVLGNAVALYLSPGMSCYTAFLNVRFIKPLPTPGFVLCRTWLEAKSEGSKLFVRGSVEDGMGEVFAEAESLWISRRSGKL